MNKFLAKTNPEETIEQHTENLIKEYERLITYYPNIRFLNKELLKIACVHHDLGKINVKFQNKLYEKLGYEKLNDLYSIHPEIPHGYLSPAFLDIDYLKQRYSKENIKILYQAIYYHHNREFDMDLEYLRNTFETFKEFLKDFNFKLTELKDLNPNYRRYLERFEKDDTENFYKYVCIKGLLNKIDYSASAHIDIEIPNENLSKKVEIFFRKRNLNTNSLQNYMKDNKDRNNVIIASTGIGKTEAALFWIGNNKGFFTLPLRVSINAIYDKLS